MIQPENQARANIKDVEAADWLSRLDRASLLTDEAELDELADREPAFGAWLHADLANRIAFLQALSAWQRTERLAALQGAPEAALPKKRGRTKSGVRFSVAGAAMAASLLIAALVAQIVWSPFAGEAEPDIYYSQIGQTRTIRLADGTQMTLNTNSRVDISFEEGIRQAVLYAVKPCSRSQKTRTDPFGWRLRPEILKSWVRSSGPNCARMHWKSP